MKIGSNKLSLAVKFALALSVGAVASAAFAQDTAPAADQQPDASKAQQMQSITVTGSRIRSVDVETQQPVFVMSQDDIKKTGLTTVGDIISRMSMVGTPDFTSASVLASNSEQGGSYVDMRNLGAQRVLVLVNGKRWSTSVAGYTDVSNIPAALIQRVEVLKDGASSVYGSDAIAGVINFILNDHFQGAQLDGTYGVNQKGDGETTNYSLTLGQNNDKGSIVFNYTYNKQGPVWASKRALTNGNDGPNHENRLFLGPWGELYDPVSGTDIVLNHANGVGASPSNDPASYHAWDGRVDDAFNASSQMLERTPTTLNSIFTHGTYNLTDNVTFKGTAMYSERHAFSQIAGYPFQPGAFSDPVLLSGQSYYNPYPGTDFQVYRRTVELPRQTRNNTNTAHLDAGLEGFFNVGEHEWNWDAGIAYNRSEGTLAGSGNLNRQAMALALGPSFLNADGVVQCGTAANPLPLGTSLNQGQCTPFDIAGGPTASTADALKFINALTTTRYGSSERSATANITGGLFNLPAGEFSFAAGVESRQEKGYLYPDLASQSGNTTDLAANSTAGRYRVNEGYVEFNAPILRDLPGAQSLSVDVASRYSHYSNFGSTTNNKYGFSWKPINDLLVRGNYAEGFRAPTLDDTFGGGSQSYDTFLDPCDTVYGAAATNAQVAARCTAAGVPAGYRQLKQDKTAITSVNGAQGLTAFNAGAGNANLQPETATTRTLGLVYSPSYVAGLDMSLDWYKIRVDNLISPISAGYVLDQCYLQGSQQYCGQFGRDPDNSQVVNLNRGNANLGYLETEGYDYSVRYRLPEYSFGRLVAQVSGSYVSKYQSQSSPDAVVAESVGQYPIYRNRANISLDWSKGAFGATWTTRYYSSIRDVCYSASECNQPNYTSPSWGYTGANRHGATAFNDVQVRWNAPWNGQFRLGINNVFNKQPSVNYLANQLGYNSASSVDPNLDLDRYFYVGYTQKF
ncbi:TonB-dependent receptor [Dyella ginsengisoli]|uniref:TonB-dependent receptor n=1 Tax=Dyella ginsengisoli TaxID=363848 RepID=A0ABW8JRT6_9GAMM